MNIVAQRVKKLREQKNLTQSKLAGDLKISQQTLSSLENQKTAFTEEYIVQFAKYFNVSTDYLLGLTDAPTMNKGEQFICDYTGLKLDTVRHFAFLKSDCFWYETLEFIEFLIDKICKTSTCTFDIVDMVEHITMLYLIYTEQKEPEIIETTDKQKIEKLIRKIAYEFKEKNDSLEASRIVVNAIKYSLNSFFSKCIDEFSVFNIDGISFKDFENAEMNFYNNRGKTI